MTCLIKNDTFAEEESIVMLNFKNSGPIAGDSAVGKTWISRLQGQTNSFSIQKCKSGCIKMLISVSAADCFGLKSEPSPVLGWPCAVERALLSQNYLNNRASQGLDWSPPHLISLSLPLLHLLTPPPHPHTPFEKLCPS